MAILASANWYVRAGGNALNGGGYDSAISGAGTNYCDQDSPQLSLTDLATSGAGSTTLTSATGGFTAAMVGNCIRIASGTNFQTGYYFVTVYTDANTVTLDRTPTSGGAGSGGTGRLGGAFANCSASLSTGGSVTAPTVTSPLAAGHTINVRGAGSDAPSIADYTQAGFAIYPSGDKTSGPIKLIGYNGRPRLEGSESLFYASLWHWVNIMALSTGVSNPHLAVLCGNDGCAAMNVRVDQNGQDRPGILANALINCELTNSGSASAGTYAAVYTPNYGGTIVGTLIEKWRGAGVWISGAIIADVSSCVIRLCGSHGIYADIAYSYGRSAINGNAIHDNGGDGIRVSTSATIQEILVVNNILTDNGGFGINVVAGTVALNDKMKTKADYNAFRGNTSGAVNGISAGAHDITLTADPFTNAAGGDFTLNGTAGGGAALKGVAFPTSIP